MKTISSFIMAIMYTGMVHSQSLNGKVLSTGDSLPVANASITAPEIAGAINTDDAGEFRLKVGQQNKVSLRISHLGFEDRQVDVEMPYDGTLVIMLTPGVQGLEEVSVSTGYQEIPMERATGAFEKIDNTMLNRNVSMDVLGRLENMTTGIYFDKSGTNFNAPGAPDHDIYLHGISTLRQSSRQRANAPLIVLDNFAYEGDINSINPNEIESITLLKDAAASSIWGAKAGNGVIVITSKKASPSKRWQVNFNQHLAVSDKPDLFAHRVIGNSDLIDVERFLFEQGYYNSMENHRAKPALPPVVELLIKQRDGLLTQAEANAQIDAYRQQDVRDDMLDHIYRRSSSQQYALSISHAGDGQRVLFSTGYDRGHSNPIGNDHSRLTFRLAHSITAIKNLEITAGGRVAIRKGRRHATGDAKLSYSNSGFPFPYVRLADDEGNPLPIPADYRMAFLDTAGSGQLLDWHFRPLDELHRPAYSENNNEIIANLAVKYRWSRYLNTDIQYQYYRQAGADTRYYDVDSYTTRNQINRGTEIVDGTPIYHYPYGGQLQTVNSTANSNQLRVQLNFSRAFASVHDVNVIVGSELNSRVSKSGGYVRYGYNESLLTFANYIDHTYRYPVYGNLATSGMVGYPVLDATEMNHRFVSFYANASYAYKNRYVISASARRDASNLFGVSTNNKWTPLWSAGIAWNINNEDFYRWDFLPLLKLRLTHGYSGNVDNSMSGLVTLLYGNNPAYTGVTLPNAGILYPPNPDLRWEKVQQYNVGLEFATKNYRLSGAMDFYIKYTEDLIEQFPLDPTTGATRMQMNVAHTKSPGFDIRLASRNLTGPLEWSTNVLLSYNNNWITRTYREYSSPASFVRPGGINVAEDIMPFSVYSYTWAGLDPETGEPRGYLDGQVSKDYRSIMSRETPLSALRLHGSARPLYMGSLMNTLSWRNLSLSANISFRLAYFFRRTSIDYSRLAAAGDGHIDFYDRWQNPGDELKTAIPAFQYPINGSADTFFEFSEVLVERGDHIRLRDVRLDYLFTPPPAWKISKASVFAVASNLGFIWRASKLGLDPDVGGNIPPSRSIAIGCNLAF